MELTPRHGFFIGVDSDGCVFDTMEIKQKECFIPVTIDVWNLQAVSKYARETFEFVNLYSKWRGTNRFKALAIEMGFLAERPEAMQRNVRLPDLTRFAEWTGTAPVLSNDAVKEEWIRSGDPVFRQALTWSEAVNERIAQMVRGVPPFPTARAALSAMARDADLIVVSQTPGEALEREWAEHGLAGYPAVIAGQEMGSKADHLIMAAGGKYPAGQVLMIGDALGDLQAARAAGALFYPINPGREEDSWRRLLDEGLARFFAREYAGAYEQDLIAEFGRLLPETPPWQR